MTSPDCASGTERVADVARQTAFSRYDAFVNVQGDEAVLLAAPVCLQQQQ